MAIGDEASAAGYPLVPNTGTGGEVALGAQEINRTRDMVAEVLAIIMHVWDVAHGGTGATTGAAARANLGISYGTAAASDAVGGAVNGNIYLKLS
jgi:hypothetical protein